MNAVTAAEQSATISQRAANLPAIAPPRLPYHPAIEERFGVGMTEWRALVDAVFPLAKETGSIIMALAYCRARKLDPFKKPVHIVPMWNGQLKRMVETVWPGIGELRTTAFRTGQFAGRDEAKYGETRKTRVGNVEIEFPEWCQVTVYRMLNGERLPFPGPRVYWMESYATSGREDNSPNAMWKRRPFGQIDKCAEAAALRAAFPEEVGNDYAAEEMEGRTIEGAPESSVAKIAPIKGLAARLDALGGPDPEHDADTGEIIDDNTNSSSGDASASSESSGAGAQVSSQAAAPEDSNPDRSSVPSERSVPPEAASKPVAAGRSSIASGGEPTAAAKAAPSLGSEESQKIAYEAGRAWKKDGKSRRAVPGEYREAGAERELDAWTNGFDDMADELTGHAGRAP